jgi:hypothetical protein
MDVTAIREALHAQPFRSFNMRLVDGRELWVTHPDFVAVSPRRVIVINPYDESTSFLEPMLIISLEIVGAAPPAGAGAAQDGGAAPGD